MDLGKRPSKGRGQRLAKRNARGTGEARALVLCQDQVESGDERRGCPAVVMRISERCKHP